MQKNRSCNVSQLLGIGCLVPDITDHRRTTASSTATPALLLLLKFRVMAQEYFPKQTATVETFTVRFPARMVSAAILSFFVVKVI